MNQSPKPKSQIPSQLNIDPKVSSIGHLKTITALSLVILVALALSGCASPTPTATPPPTAALIQLPTTMPTATAEPSPTPMPILTPDIALIRGPYLQSVTTSSVIVVWETNLPSHGEVVYGETEEYGSSVADLHVDTRHVITLTGLAPYTVYHYRVESSGAPLSEDATFRTAASPDQATFTFVVFGDTRTQDRIHQAVVERIRALAPDFVLHTGDLVGHGRYPYLWQAFFEIERDLMIHVPLFPTLGNHEENDPLYFDLFHLPGNERWYTLDYGNARFVCLQVDRFVDFGPGSEQYVWLEETLGANTQPWLFVYFHIPPYSSLSEEAEEIEVRETLTPLFEQYGVDVVFTGHHHNYQRSVVNGVTYIVTGGGGAPLYRVKKGKTDDYLLSYKNTYHVVSVTIARDTLTSVGVTPEGEEFDRFTLTLPQIGVSNDRELEPHDVVEVQDIASAPCYIHTLIMQ